MDCRKTHAKRDTRTLLHNVISGYVINAYVYERVCRKRVVTLHGAMFDAAREIRITRRQIE